MKTTPVEVLIDGEVVGSGELAYKDLSYPSLSFLQVEYCDETPMYVDASTVPVLLCWGDTVSSGLGGSVERTLEVPVYIGNTEVGYAVIRVQDSYSPALIDVLALLAVLAMAVLAVRGLLRGVLED